jgi:hypothetical protein
MEQEMNIANIFGLHLGCKCKNDTDEFTVLGIRPDTTDGCESMYIQGEYNDLYSIKTCKLLLKPLSAINTIEQVEFSHLFLSDECLENLEVCRWGYLQVEYLTPSKTKRPCTVEETLWLASKGFDIGIVPPEYMEIVE